ncbi:MAG: hypothetical protein KF832_23520 [Caldilineaceae bacterium]|nr:hypothetical protein [Caldilineaceae bacterium]
MPIATLPQEFADRLTQAVLDEVKRLHQANPSSTQAADEATGNAKPQQPMRTEELAKPQLSTAKTTATLLFWLWLSFALLPGLQGCALTTELSRTNSQSVLAMTLLPQPSQRIEHTPLADVAHLPPLAPIQPTLPIIAGIHRNASLRPTRLGNAPGAASFATAPTFTPLSASATSKTQNQPALLPTTTVITITMPYEQALHGKPEKGEAEPTTTVPPIPPTNELAPTEVAPQPTNPPPKASRTPTPTVMPTAAPQTPPATLTSAYAVFEPTPTPGEEIPTATTIQAPTPTIFIQPWHSPEPANTALPPTTPVPAETTAP